ncbi:5-nucleotidase family protein [gut metagenome]|uniref:5-nucleotidase family protein n=1 Tax=gut metagenome TaxID=749906 RepID=J9G5J1_9ZZZZ
MNWNLVLGFLCGGCMLFSACRPSYQVTHVEGGRVAIDSTWETMADVEMQALIAPYKAKVDSVMFRIIGQAEVSMNARRPESLLSNLVADILRESASETLGKPADVGLVNMGGLRSVLTKGPVTVANAYEILPFENTLCILTMKGDKLKLLLENVAARGGEGISGVKLQISADGKLLAATLNGRPVKDGQDYTVATIDYLAEGNDGMTACLQASERVCPKDGTLRNLFIRYVEKLTQCGKKVTSRLEGRIVVK